MEFCEEEVVKIDTIWNFIKKKCQVVENKTFYELKWRIK